MSTSPREMPSLEQGTSRCAIRLGCFFVTLCLFETCTLSLSLSLFHFVYSPSSALSLSLSLFNYQKLPPPHLPPLATQKGLDTGPVN